MVPKKGILTNVHNVDIISAMSEYQDNYISINNLPIISARFSVLYVKSNCRISDYIHTHRFKQRNRVVEYVLFKTMC